MIIKQATVADVPLLQLIGRQTFMETFGENNKESDLQQYLADNFSEEHVREEIENPNSLFYIAWDDSEAVGYLKVNFLDAQTELQEPDSMEIERIYVKSDFLGKQVGKLLYEKAVKIAEAHKKSSIWLGVWENNPRAIRFYEKNGFAAFDKHIFKMGDDDQTDIMMRKPL